MFGDSTRSRLMVKKSQVGSSTPLYAFLALGSVAALLFWLPVSRAACAREDNKPDSATLEFTCRVDLPIGSGRLDGLMVSEGARQRIAIYWMEPAMFREAPSFLRCCDLLFAGDVVHYWIQGMSEPGTFHLSDGEKDPLLPAQKSAESVLRSALAIISQIRCPRDEGQTPLEVDTFFQRSRGQAQYKYGVSANEVDGSQSFDSADSGAQILNALGREYSKETRDDGSMVWRARKGTKGPPIATVTIQRLGHSEPDAARGPFNQEILGRWALVPEVYRAYWSFAQTLETIRASLDVGGSARDLYGHVDSYLDQNKVPPEVGRALDRLRFQAALRTGDNERVWHSTRRAVAGLCDEDAVPLSQLLFELGSMSGHIQERFPQGLEEHLRPLVAQIVQSVRPEKSVDADLPLAEIASNGWFIYGKLLLEEVQRKGVIQKQAVDSLMAGLEASQRARQVAPPDPCEFRPSIRQYLSRMDADPPRGLLEMSDIRHILDEGLSRSRSQVDPQVKGKVIGDVIRSIHLIVGDGPFCGDQPRLIEAVSRFSEVSLVVDRAAESIDTVLATFLALSFCDTSTRADHDVLSAQIARLWKDFQSKVNAMLDARGLSLLVAPAEVQDVFAPYERTFRRYVDDPLWPAFKFPLTSGELAKLAGKLDLRLIQLGPALDEISLKVKYGGASAQLRERTVSEISRAAQQLLPEAAFLRNPPYPGISCQYRGGYGFTAMIKGPLYQEGNRPKERFRAMKYFHLGHRLQSVVERERELLTPPGIPGGQ